MLLIESKTLGCAPDEATRLLLLDALQSEQFVPLVRSARRRCFELLLPSAPGQPPEEQKVRELESRLLTDCLARAPLSSRAAFLHGRFSLYLISRGGGARGPAGSLTARTR